MKKFKLELVLTNSEIEHAKKLVTQYGDAAVGPVDSVLIRPNLERINRDLRQENDARYLAYAVVYALTPKGGTHEMPQLR